mgnify:CR=1 FL=1
MNWLKQNWKIFALLVLVTGILFFIGIQYDWNFIFQRYQDEKEERLWEDTMKELRLRMINSLVFVEEIMPKYRDFLKELEKKCPYYKPSGVAYRGCLEDLLDKKDKKIKSFSDELIKDVRTAMAEKNNNYDSYLELLTSGQEPFLDVFQNLQKSWWSYRDELCQADNAGHWLGSNYYGYVATCKLYESEKNFIRLVSYRHEWVVSQLEMYKENNWQPKTQAFRDLMAREEELLR